MTNICKKVNFEEVYGCCDTSKRTIAYLIFGERMICCFLLKRDYMKDIAHYLFSNDEY